MKFRLYTPQAIHQLGKRKNQEDTIYPVAGAATVEDRLFLVCDGMGGHEKGEVASAAVCEGISKAITENYQPGKAFSDEQFQQALERAFDTLDAADVNHEGKMGTTMTFLCLHKGGCLVAHIGDSRIYHLRPKTGQVLYRSRDHSLVQQLYELGEISYNDMGTSQRKNIILKAMQPFQEERSKATLVHITDIRPDDYFYLCSDGMLEQMEDDELLSILQADTTDEEKTAELVKRTAENGDNHSAYLLHIKDVEHEPGDELLVSDEEEARRKNKALNDNRKDEVWDKDTDEAAPVYNHATKVEHAVAHSANSKKYVIPLIALLLALAAVAIVLLCGKGEKETADDEEDEPETEVVVGSQVPSAKEEAIQQTEVPYEQRQERDPDFEPQPLAPQVTGKAGAASKFGAEINY